MPDERTYGFNKDDANSLVQSIHTEESWFPEIKPRGGGSRGALTVRFRIVAATEYCADCYATARVISGPPSVTNPDTLPGSTFDYEAQYYTIKVYDMGEGWLNYPPEELLNMIGHATWLRSYEDGPCSEVPGLHWEIIDMQDPEEENCES